MDALKKFSITFQGLKNGIHQFEYQIDRSFFKNFEDSALNDASFVVKLDLEREETMLVLNFEFEGTMVAECDRCLEMIDMPMSGTQRLMAKFSEEEKEEEDDVFYIQPKAPELNVSKYVYELVHLGIPIRKVKPDCDDFPKDCPTNLIGYIEKIEDTTPPNSEAKDQISEESVWSVLNKFKN